MKNQKEKRDWMIVGGGGFQTRPYDNTEGV